MNRKTFILLIGAMLTIGLALVVQHFQHRLDWWMQGLAHADPWARVDNAARPAASKNPLAGAIYTATRLNGGIKYGVEGGEQQRIGPVEPTAYGPEVSQLKTNDPGPYSPVVFVVAKEEHGSSLWTLSKSGKYDQAPLKLAAFKSSIESFNSSIESAALFPDGQSALVAADGRLYRVAADGTDAAAPVEWAALPDDVHTESMQSWADESRIVVRARQTTFQRARVFLASIAEPHLVELDPLPGGRVGTELVARLAPGVALIQSRPGFFAASVTGLDTRPIPGANADGVFLALTANKKYALHLSGVPDGYCHVGTEQQPAFVPVEPPPPDLATQPSLNGGWLCTGMTRGRIVLVPLTPEGSVIPVAEGIDQLAIAPDGRHVLLWKESQLSWLDLSSDSGKMETLGNWSQVRFLVISDEGVLHFNIAESIQRRKVSCLQATFPVGRGPPSISEADCDVPRSARPKAPKLTLDVRLESALFRLDDNGKPLRLTAWTDRTSESIIGDDSTILWKERYGSSWSVFRNNATVTAPFAEIPSHAGPLGFLEDAVLTTENGKMQGDTDVWSHSLSSQDPERLVGTFHAPQRLRLIKEAGVLVAGGLDCGDLPLERCFRRRDQDVSMMFLPVDGREKSEPQPLFSGAASGVYLGYSKALDQGVFFTTKARTLPAAGALQLVDFKARPPAQISLGDVSFGHTGTLLADRFVALPLDISWTLVPLRPGALPIHIGVGHGNGMMTAIDERWQAFATKDSLCVLPLPPAGNRQAECASRMPGDRTFLSSNNTWVVSVNGAGQVKVSEVKAGAQQALVKHHATSELRLDQVSYSWQASCGWPDKCLIQFESSVLVLNLPDATISTDTMRGTGRVTESPGHGAVFVSRDIDTGSLNDGLIDARGSVAWLAAPAPMGVPLVTHLIHGEDGVATGIIGFAGNRFEIQAAGVAKTSAP